MPAKDEMRAVTIDRFGGPEALSVRNFPVPEVEPNQILIRVESAGIGIWDLAGLRGMIAQRDGVKPIFPWILGSEGAGRVVAVGDKVSGFQEGDLVYGAHLGDEPKARVLRRIHGAGCGAGFADPLQPHDRAGGRSDDRRHDRLSRDSTRSSQLKPGEKLMVFGAGGGIGHLAVQFATRMGAHVFAVASGEDGVALARRLGAEGAVEGHHGDIVAAARRFAPDGFDAALITAHGDAADRALTTMRDGRTRNDRQADRGRPSRSRPPSVCSATTYPRGTTKSRLARLNRLIEAGPFEVHLGRTFSLDQVVDAYRTLNSHYLGRLALLPTRKP